MSDRDTARAAKEHLRAQLAALAGVNGVGIGRRGAGYVLTVNVTERTASEGVPGSCDGVPVEVRVVGPVRARRPDDDPTSPAHAPARLSDADAGQP